MVCCNDKCSLQVENATSELNGTVISIYCISSTNCTGSVEARQTHVFNYEIVFSGKSNRSIDIIFTT